MPLRKSCASLMWLAGFSGVCSMLMTQVVLAGFYSFLSRRSPFFTIFGIVPAALFRMLFFCVTFYIFFGFMFCFIFFWVAMMICDNPHALSRLSLSLSPFLPSIFSINDRYDWYQFGYLYPRHFIEFWDHVASAHHWDGNMDVDAFVGFHTGFSLLIDIIFVTIYIFMSFVKDDRKVPYLQLSFFDLWNVKWRKPDESGGKILCFV